MATLGEADRFAGIVEFDARYLHLAGTSPEGLLAEMRSLGAVLAISKEGVHPVRDVGELRRHGDLLFCSDGRIASQLNIPSLLR